ncbi:response regulator [Rhodobacter sphaeroides]|jgi:Response regulator containing a CheY-like receiver domain and a GGDEF domain|uniref:Chemotaxis response regulator, CheY5 n=2 Tax=Cereibacter sphaeroides TaxID=1063 RepID=Q3J3N0_CERS4|nr:response regulator [Cereibacter sphaeroides]ABN76217.1 response regulator receiver protein [Cereibacter sphaeroides ATCC 17029]EKX57299.1 Chemotaxis regulator - transmits chemoreceptor signals to flagelllar motor components CheY [Rhodobacter sp. AKP1]ABA78604.1 putative Chemotaxis response regulator, CheY5 [Cereibacter sphaeroides 2.4.1]AMJ46952.1 two-component system response regulator [Cereibacter sphaeroides]ANS33664.1 two-component system response regulator [Cereibacter sphaeroides]
MSKTILAVDDSPSVRQMVRLTLVGAGYTVVEAVDGQDALEKATAQRFDAILTDQNMPRLDGIGFIRKFRTLPEGKGVPIVFLSTESQDTLKAQAKEAGAIGWMIKPFDQAQLLAVVKKVAGA